MSVIPQFTKSLALKEFNPVSCKNHHHPPPPGGFLPFNIKLLTISLANRYCKLFCEVASRIWGTQVAGRNSSSPAFFLLSFLLPPFFFLQISSSPFSNTQTLKSENTHFSRPKSKHKQTVQERWTFLEGFDLGGEQRWWLSRHSWQQCWGVSCRSPLAVIGFVFGFDGCLFSFPLSLCFVYGTRAFKARVWLAISRLKDLRC